MRSKEINRATLKIMYVELLAVTLGKWKRFFSESHTCIPVESVQVTHNAVENQTIQVVGAAKTNVSKTSASTTNNATPEARDPKTLPVAHLPTSTALRTVCIHVLGMHKFVRAVSDLYKCDDRNTARALADLYASKFEVSFATFPDDCPSA